MKDKNRIIEKNIPISLKKQTGIFFKQIKPNKIANNYIKTLKINNIKKGSNNTLNINQKYLIKLSDLSKLSELNNMSITNQLNNNTSNIIQTAPNQTKAQNLLNSKKLNNIKKFFKINYKKRIFSSLLSKKNESIFNNLENKNYTERHETNEIDSKRNKSSKSSEKAKNKLSNFLINKNFGGHQSLNMRNKFKKKKLMEVLNNYNKSNITNKTFDVNILNSNYYLNSNSTRKETSDRINKDILPFQPDSFRSINLIKENNEKILNRLLSNKENKNININIKYFYKKNVKNVNRIFYNTFNNISTQKLIFNSKDNYNCNTYRGKKKDINKKEIFRQGKSYAEIKYKPSKNNNYLFNLQRINLIKNNISFRNNNISLNNYTNRDASKTYRFKTKNNFNNLLFHKNEKSCNKINKIRVSNLLSKPINQKYFQIKNKFKLKYFHNQDDYINDKYKFNRKTNSENNFNFKMKKNKMNKKSIIPEIKIRAKSLKNEKKIKSENKKDTKENFKPKKKPKNLILNNRIDIKKINKYIKLLFGLKEKEEKNKEKPKIKHHNINNLNKKLLANSFSNSSYSNIKEIINSDDSLSIDNNQNNSKEYDEKEIESITKKLDFDKYNEFSEGNIFYLENNEEYNIFKENFDKRYNKKITFKKLLNNDNYINNLYKK